MVLSVLHMGLELSSRFCSQLQDPAEPPAVLLT